MAIPWFEVDARGLDMAGESKGLLFRFNGCILPFFALLVRHPGV